MNTSMAILAAALASFVVGCAPATATLDGYSREIKTKQSEIDRLQREISVIRKTGNDSLSLRRTDSLERRVAREESDLVDLKRSASKESARYNGDRPATFWTRDNPDPKAHPIQ